VRNARTERKVPRNLSYRTVGVGGDPGRAKRDALIALFSWAEERTQLTIDWYLWRKTSRGRWSKTCRGMAILFGILGGITPVLHTAYPPGPSPEWGFVLLGSSGGFVLTDRIFGFSSSWTRFMRTQATLQADLATAQARFLSWQTRFDEETGDDQATSQELIDLVHNLVDATTAAVFQETASWADDLAIEIEQANARFVVGGNNEILPERNAGSSPTQAGNQAV
jgi:hypothetical protein